MADSEEHEPANDSPLRAQLEALTRENAELRAQLARGRTGEASAPGEPCQEAADGEPETHRALRESEARFRTLADNIAQLAWIADGQGWIFWYNKRWFDFTGTSLQDMAGWGWQSVHHPDHVERVVAKIRRSFDTGEEWEDTFPLRAMDGSYRWFLSRALPIRGQDGRIVRWFGTNTDVTEQREAEERLHGIDRRKNEFIAMLGHELRNPLAAIRNATAVLKGCETDNPELLQALGVLQRQSNHMASLVDGLLNVSRIARGKIDLHRRSIDLREIVGFVAQDQGVIAQSQGLSFHWERPDEPIWVYGDPIRLTQVFENLVGNAIKFSSPPGHVAVRVERTHQAIVRVIDSGRGIRPEMLTRIFQPFEQEEQPAARTAGGLGLGLALAKGLVDMHDGQIEAHSVGVGTGAEFVVHLPLTQPPHAQPSTVQKTEVTAHRLLLVEDNVDAAAMLRFLLQKRGHQVAVVHRAADGLEHLGHHAVDMVICDLGLPDMSGLEFARSVRAQASLEAVHLVALTGYGQSRDRRRSREAGFNAHLTKPVDVDAIERLMLERQSG